MTAASLKRIKEKARKASSSGTLSSGSSTSGSGAKGSPQAKGQGSTVIVYDPEADRLGQKSTAVVDTQTGQIKGSRLSFIQPQQTIESGRKQTISQRHAIKQQKEAEAIEKQFQQQRQKEYLQTTGRKDRPAQQLAAIQRLDRPEPKPYSAEWIARRQGTPYGTPSEQLISRTKKKLEAQSLEEAYTAHYPTTTVRKVTKTPEGTSYTTTRIGTQVSERKSGKMPTFIELESGEPYAPAFKSKPKSEITQKLKGDQADFTKAISPYTGRVAVGAAKIASDIDLFIKPVVQKVIPEGAEGSFYKQADIARGEGVPGGINVFLGSLRSVTSIKQDAQPITSTKKTGFFSKADKEIKAGVLEFAGGFTGGLRDKPTQTIATTAAFFVLPPVLKGISTLHKATKVSSTLGVIGSYGLPLLYGGSIATRVALEPGRKAATLGRITSTEVAPMAVGGFAGAYVWPKVSGLVATRGRTELPLEKVATKKVIEIGTLEKVPTSKHLGLFKKGEAPFDPPKGLEYSYIRKGAKRPIIVYHAGTSGKETAFSNTLFSRSSVGEVGIGKDYVPGGFVAPGGHGALFFLKAGYQPPKIYGGSLFGGYTTSKIAAIYPKGVRVRKTIAITKKSSVGIGKTTPRRFLGKDKPGVVDIPGIKLEPEGIIPPGTKIKRLRQQYFIKVKRTRIPVDEFGTTGLGSTSKTKASTSIFKISSEYKAGRSAAVTPSSLLVASAMSPGYSRSSRSSSSSSSVSRSLTSSVARSVSSSSSPSYSLSKSTGYSTSKSPSYSFSKSPSYSTSRSTGSSTGYSSTSSPGYSLTSLVTTSQTTKQPPLFLLGEPGKAKKKKKKRIKLFGGMYQPQIRAVYQGGKFKAPAILTGIGYERGLKI